MCDTTARAGRFQVKWSMINARVESLIGALSWLGVFGFIAALVAKAIG
jgi:hypothetical protein